MVGTATLQCKRVKAHAVSAQYAVGVSAKRSTGTVELANMGGGDHYPSVQKVKAHAVSAQYTVGVSAKKSTGTVELANMGGGDRYPLVQEGQTPHAVGMQYTVPMQ